MKKSIKNKRLNYLKGEDKKKANEFIASSKDGKKNAEFIKELNVFYHFGENCYWYPSKIPSDPYLISIHNNVSVAAHANFITHDVISTVFENEDKKNYPVYLGTIEVFDNVFIGTNSSILYNTKIGPNAIVAAGSVVTKDVPEGTIVAGNPAKVVGDYYKLKEKRQEYAKTIGIPIKNDTEDDINIIANRFWNI